MVNRGVHPLAGRTGEGPPIAPVGWKWAAGRRRSDMYFRSPDGKKFRSKLRLAAYLSSIPNAPSVSEFCWRFSLADFGSPLPGTHATPMRGCIKKKSKRRKIQQGSPVMLKIKEYKNKTATDLTEPVHELTIFEQELLISSLQKTYNEGVVDWCKSKEKACQCKSLFIEAKKQLKLAKAEVALKAEQVHVVHKALRRARRRLGMLLRNHETKPFSENEIETQKKILDAEGADLKNLFKKIINLNITDGDFIMQFSSLLESQKLQRKRLDFAKARLRHMKISTASS